MRSSLTEGGSKARVSATVFDRRWLIGYSRSGDSDGRRQQRLARDNHVRHDFVGSVGKIVATDETDGLRYSLAGGEILHLRASGNAPELRCYAEAADSLRAGTILAAGRAAAARFAGS